MARSAAFEPAPVSRDHVVAARRATEPSASAQAIRRGSVREPQGPPQVPVPAGTTWVTGSASPGARPGADFSRVRVHTDLAARASVTEVGARPGTFGSPGPTTWLTVAPSPVGGRASHERQRLRPGGAPLGAAPAGPRPSAVPARPIPEVLRGPGQPLAAPLREEMQARLGADFSHVRVHTDPTARASAAEVGARAYTSGSHVVIGEGGADKLTLAHELTHVIQQRQGPVAGTDHGNGFKVSDPFDAHEKAAEANAARVMRAPLSQHRLTAAGSSTHGGTGESSSQVVSVLDGTAGRFQERAPIRRLRLAGAASPAVMQRMRGAERTLPGPVIQRAPADAAAALAQGRKGEADQEAVQRLAEGQTR